MLLFLVWCLFLIIAIGLYIDGINQKKHPERYPNWPTKPIPITIHATLISKTPQHNKYGYYKEKVIFRLDDHSRIATVVLSRNIATLLPGDTGMLTYKPQPDTPYMFFISFVPDSSPATEADASLLAERTSDAAMLATIISILPESDTSRVLFEFIDKHRVSLNLPRSQADLLAPGDKGTLVYEDSTFVSFTRT